MNYAVATFVCSCKPATVDRFRSVADGAPASCEKQRSTNEALIHTHVHTDRRREMSGSHVRRNNDENDEQALPGKTIDFY